MKIKTKCEDCNKKKDCEVFEYNGRFRSQCGDCRKLEVNKNRNFGLPELEKLEEVVAQFDYMLQEGVIYKRAERDRALSLIIRLEDLIKELVIKS